MPLALIILALRENSKKPPIGGDLSVLAFLGLLISGLPAMNADLRQLPTESSAFLKEP